MADGKGKKRPDFVVKTAVQRTDSEGNKRDPSWWTVGIGYSIKNGTKIIVPFEERKRSGPLELFIFPMKDKQDQADTAGKENEAAEELYDENDIPF